MPRGNINNLIDNNALTPEQRKESASRAGKASAVARKKKKTLQEWAQIMMQIPATDPRLIEQMEAAGIPEDQRTAGAEMILAVQNKVRKKGDEAALKVIRDTAGEVPVQRVAVAGVDDLRTLTEADLRAALDGVSEG